MSVPETFRAFQATKTDEGVDCAVVDVPATDLAEGAAVAVEWSSVNYKDALAARPKGGVARLSPLIPGIDLAGTLVDDVGDLAAGAPVLAHGYDIGVARHGGFATYATVEQDWLVPLPDGLTAREAMTIGTAGYTAALSVIALEKHGIAPADGPVLVTGATGGVGSVAVDLLAGQGWEVVASTGKPEAADLLTDLGASSVIDRASLSEAGGRPLDKMEWIAAVDCVGGQTLANVLTKITNFGAVAASGLTGGADLPTTVLPFILRGVSLLGIDSVMTPPATRREVWKRLATDLRPRNLATIGSEVGLDGIDAVMDQLIDGKVTGRTLVDVSR